MDNATVFLNGLLSFIESMSLTASNKQWLAERLLNDAKLQSEKEQSYDDFIDSMCGAWNDDPRSTEEIMRDIRKARQFNKTRHIKPL